MKDRTVNLAVLMIFLVPSDDFCHLLLVFVNSLPQIRPDKMLDDIPERFFEKACFEKFCRRQKTCKTTTQHAELNNHLEKK